MDRLRNPSGVHGFSLTELIIVLAIATTLMSVATIDYHQWQVKHNVESQVKVMVSDFNELRVRALTTKQRQSITLNKKNYIFKSYSSDDEPLAAGTVTLPAIHGVNYALKTDNSTFCNGQTFEIDHRGIMVGVTGSIYLDANSSATLDCLRIQTVRINPGKKNDAWSMCNDR